MVVHRVCIPCPFASRHGRQPEMMYFSCGTVWFWCSLKTSDRIPVVYNYNSVTAPPDGGITM